MNDIFKNKPKKSLGQNFLINENINKKIVDIAQCSNKNVIEIGPGKGALTRYLISEAKNVIAYEIDKDLIEDLENLKASNLKIVNIDFLKIKDLDFENQIVIGNIPYYITSDIIFKLLEFIFKIERIVLLIQEEVADRICAIPKTKEYGKLAVSLQACANCQKLLKVKAENFYPIPKVNSAVIKIEFKKQLDFDLKNFLEFTKTIFQFKRKTLFNNLKNKYSLEKINQIFNANNLTFKTRSEELEVVQIIKLFKSFSN
ncbi:16S rRNA (adenine(1518)-N(6)/adenine(1519)-N(6))-dimethyltransferase RsmA [Metamycoplasma hyosynoviae]|uniref:Ribosomal RNA small subunit methyltransferase A n=1 Tax=Metamycoplasma hyosynoviae TaxID=29559 RepID=A0A4R7TVH2_9BACT|nr:16S rRNA (adenine(1518)-N(6)/adenine(1519)-N(6))-dimethyltransferase RsmA [Metamycoplasma hyosynoviae]MDC8900927.1 16S rRNA (adenine(1518)-N(6)/adenine(1519)-N(6))-dimethyltransferase RsmA [Metamycoplasma hyosynoviae]MDC8912389.1 16S rRNA (adenine(1518)-N(6)/adenine(1519)-N(6))-dimethyltransferase RsmA [Metamycoplasma hyosynoviae]MDC8914912.1 16S rRNA (adenine(1518)-N(6)/adenine(1519)-N(6))-dimethyltransferase RsmA [Metamycoplasma hyosynoviae]MDD7908117.1 16S rRNA (adenine(1518)-N(6)/adenine